MRACSERDGNAVRRGHARAALCAVVAVGVLRIRRRTNVVAGSHDFRFDAEVGRCAPGAVACGSRRRAVAACRNGKGTAEGAGACNNAVVHVECGLFAAVIIARSRSTAVARRNCAIHAVCGKKSKNFFHICLTLSEAVVRAETHIECINFEPSAVFKCRKDLGPCRAAVLENLHGYDLCIICNTA